MRRIAVLSLHTSPLVQPGSGDGGGMNVYVRELVSALAQAGGQATVFVRRADETSPGTVEVEPGVQVVHIDAGPPDMPKEDLPQVVDRFADGVSAHLVASELDGHAYDGLLANYWLSGVAGHRLKHELELPLTTVFHTLARVKAETGDPEPQRRLDAEASVIACSDIILANSDEEARQLVDLYAAEPSRVEVVPPGVDHAFFSPGYQGGAREAVGLGPGPVLLFVGRIQPLKGVDVAVRTLADLDRTASSWSAEPAVGMDLPRSAGSVRWSTGWTWPTGSPSCRPSHTTACPPGTGPPTCSSCPAAPSRSAWWPWRPPPAGCRWLPLP